MSVLWDCLVDTTKYIGYFIIMIEIIMTSFALGYDRFIIVYLIDYRDYYRKLNLCERSDCLS